MMAQGSTTKNFNDLEAEEVAAAAAHAELPVEPSLPGVPSAGPPGFDQTQLIIDMAKMTEQMADMKAQLLKVTNENAKLKSIYTNGAEPGASTASFYPMTPQKEEVGAGLPSTTPKS